MNVYLKPPPMDNTLPHLFYTNLKTIAPNKIVKRKHQVKHSNLLHKMFILKHVPLISNCQYCQVRLVASIINCYIKKMC